MRMTSLPFFIQAPYQTLRNADIEGERAKLVQDIFSKVISFLGKLVLLEYLQGNCKSPSLTYWLLRSQYPSMSQEWIGCFKKITLEFLRQGGRPVVSPLMAIREKYPSLCRDDETEDRITRLLWFSDMLSYSEYLVSLPDIEENEEHLTALLEELSFLETAQYQTQDNKATLIFGGKPLLLAPFYTMRQNNGKMLLDIGEEGPEALEKACGIWIPDELQKYRRQRGGDLDFAEVTSCHSLHIRPPWLEIALEQSLQNIFTTIAEVESQNVLLVEGYPASGKTALAANIAQYFPQADQCFCYFIAPHSPMQESTTFEKWLREHLNTFLHIPAEENEDTNPQEELLRWLLNCRHAFNRTLPRIVVAVDGLENMPKADYLELRRFIQHAPLNRMVFILLKRLYDDPEIEATQRMDLSCEDNVYFERTFTVEYIQALKNRYLQDGPLSAKIFSLLTQRSPEFMSAVDIAEAIGAFTPEVLKTLVKIKPLCATRVASIFSKPGHERFPVEQYRPFHPICHKFF